MVLSLWARHCYKHYKDCSHLVLTTTLIGPIISILQLMKLRHRNLPFQFAIEMKIVLKVVYGFVLPEHSLQGQQFLKMWSIGTAESKCYGVRPWTPYNSILGISMVVTTSLQIRILKQKNINLHKLVVSGRGRI